MARMGSVINKAPGMTRCLQQGAGFTLIELLAVIGLLSLILLIVFPRLHLSDEVIFRTEARKVAGTLRYLNESAVTRKVYYRIWFSLDDEIIEVESSNDGLNFAGYHEPPLKGLKRGVGIEEVILPSLGRISSGKVAVVLSPSGPVEAFVLHLKRGDKQFNLLVSPSGRVRIQGL
ncbi:MAG: prepilin-type N-terminal cleavage/methylation domain-containing protein [Deltaproteobacteria bacterium]|nr:prepilin-type N-terminal cleavage/methylation domain-containing protein [Deltaproteobacteria bacterium]